MIPILNFLGDAPAGCVHAFLGLIPWYQYLSLRPAPDCSLNLDLTTSGNWIQLWLVVVALLDDLLRIAGILAVAFVIWGGIKLMTSQGEPQGIANARNTIINALIGVAIALVSTDIVNYIGTQLGGTSSASGLPNVVADSSLPTNILNIVFGVAGAIAVLMVVIGGFKYVVSRGEPQPTASAKNTILYALIGLAVVILAFSIVNFVIIKLSS